MTRWVITLLLALAGAALPVAAARAAQPNRAAPPAGGAPADSGHLVRQAPGAQASPGRQGRRHSLAFFAHLSDTQIADEASPARHEQLYGRHPMYSGFWRPQEAFVLHAVDQTVRAVNRNLTSRLPSASGPARLGFALVTGDLADTAQVNEVRWGVRVLEGGWVDPFSGRRISRANPCDAPPRIRRQLNRSVALRHYAGWGGQAAGWAAGRGCSTALSNRSSRRGWRSRGTPCAATTTRCRRATTDARLCRARRRPVAASSSGPGRCSAIPGTCCAGGCPRGASCPRIRGGASYAPPPSSAASTAVPTGPTASASQRLGSAGAPAGPPCTTPGRRGRACAS